MQKLVLVKKLTNEIVIDKFLYRILLFFILNFHKRPTFTSILTHQIQQSQQLSHIILMNNFQPFDQFRVKQQHSEIFTLRSIDSSEEMLEILPVYNYDQPTTEYKSGHWSAKQHIKYVMFLDYFSDIFNVKHNIKLWKIFTIMSTFIKTRNSSQCRSHHQKTQRKLHFVHQILRTQKAKYCNYDLQYQKMKQVLRKLPVHNPIQVSEQIQSVQYIPSLKILQESIEQPVYRSSISLVDINHMQKQQKSFEAAGSERIIHYPKEKYIASEVSIEMEDQSEYFSQQKVKLLYQNNCINRYKQKASWLFNQSFGQNSYRKDQKFDRTADSLFNDGLNMTITEQKVKVNSQPEKQSVNIEKDQVPTDQTIKSSVNLVRKNRSRTRSSLPSYDCIDVESVKANPSKFRQKYEKSKLQTPQGKCKTLPPRSINTQGEDSWMNEKKQNNQPVIKSLFSGFVSSLQSGNDYIEGNQNDFPQNQLVTFNNFCNERQSQNVEQMLDIDYIRKSQSQIEDNYEKENILFCDDKIKGNLCNQISEEEYGDQDSIQFVLKKFLKTKKYSEDDSLQKHNQYIKKFTKKKSQQVDLPHQEEQVQASQHNNFQQANQAQNNGIQNYYNNSQYLLDLQAFYHQNQYSQQYPLLQYNYQQIVQTYIYFLIYKIQMNHMYLDPN